MRLLLLIPITVLAAAAGLYALARRRRGDEDVTVSSDPVSADWLAQARGRDDHHW
jgi:hypothetical protein